MHKIWLALLMAVWMTGCSGQLSSPAPEITYVPRTAPATAAPTPVPPTAEASATLATQETTPTAGGPLSDCVQTLGFKPELPDAPYSSLAETIEAFMNEGGTPQQLDERLYAAGRANLPTPVAVGDFDGDRLRDLVVSIYDSADLHTPPAGEVLVYLCRQGEYGLAFRHPSEQDWGAPGIRSVRDLDGDQLDELVTGSASCGASTCFEKYEVFGWREGKFVQRLEGSSAELPYPTLEIVDVSGEGVSELIVTASGFGSAGAGPQRNIVRRWRLNPSSGNWEQQADEQAASSYRIHVLHDADAAFEQGNYEEALVLYTRVSDDPALQDMEYEFHAGQNQSLRAYALFKTYLVYLIAGNTEQAAMTLERLAGQYPANDPAYIFVELARTFRSAFTAGTASTACQAVRDKLAGPAQPVLAIFEFGYGNPVYTAQTICPIP